MQQNPLDDEYWNLLKRPDDQWIKWHGKDVNIGLRPKEIRSRPSGERNGALFEGDYVDFQCNTDFTIVSRSSTIYDAIPQKSGTIVSTRMDLSELLNLPPRCVRNAAWILLPDSTLLVDLDLALTQDGNHRWVVLIDVESNRVLSQKQLLKSGRSLWPPIQLTRNNFALDLHFDALVFDLSSFRLLGELYANAKSPGPISHVEHELLSAVRVGENNCVCHWGQVGTSLFESYRFSPSGEWEVTSQKEVESNEIENVIEIAEEIWYAELWLNSQDLQQDPLNRGDKNVFEIGSIRSLENNHPSIPLLCISANGLVDLSALSPERGFGVARFDPMLTVVSNKQLAYLDPSGNIVVTTLQGDYTVVAPPNSKRFRILRYDGDLIAGDDDCIRRITCPDLAN